MLIPTLTPEELHFAAAADLTPEDLQRSKMIEAAREAGVLTPALEASPQWAAVKSGPLAGLEGFLQAVDLRPRPPTPGAVSRGGAK